MHSEMTHSGTDKSVPYVVILSEAKDLAAAGRILRQRRKDSSGKARRKTQNPMDFVADARKGRPYDNKSTVR